MGFGGLPIASSNSRRRASRAAGQSGSAYSVKRWLRATRVPVLAQGGWAEARLADRRDVQPRPLPGLQAKARRLQLQGEVLAWPTRAGHGRRRARPGSANDPEPERAPAAMRPSHGRSWARARGPAEHRSLRTSGTMYPARHAAKSDTNPPPTPLPRAHGPPVLSESLLALRTLARVLPQQRTESIDNSQEIMPKLAMTATTATRALKTTKSGPTM